jgi:hypothetical protein
VARHTSHQHRAPSLRNPVPVLRTNNQRSRVVALTRSYSKSVELQAFLEPSAGPRTNNQRSRVVWLDTVAPSQSRAQAFLGTQCRSSNKQSKEQSRVRHGRTKSIELQAFSEPSAGPSNKQSKEQSSSGSTRSHQVNRAPSLQPTSAGPSNKQSKEQSSVASTRSHQVNRAPSLPRNPVPVLRTNNQRNKPKS